MVTAEDADAGENGRLTYNIEPTSGQTDHGLFNIAADSGRVTWSSELTNQSSLTTVCSWTLRIRVSDHAPPPAKQLWTLVSLDVVIDDCDVDEVVYAASRQTHGGRLPWISDWHVFVVAVAIATCVVVVGCLLTVVVALRQCGRRRRRCKTTNTTTTTTTATTGQDEDHGELMLKLIPNPAQNSDVSSDVSSLTDHVVLVVDQLLSNSHRQQLVNVNDVTLIRAALQQAHMHAPPSLQVSAQITFAQAHPQGPMWGWHLGWL